KLHALPLPLPSPPPVHAVQPRRSTPVQPRPPSQRMHATNTFGSLQSSVPLTPASGVGVLQSAGHEAAVSPVSHVWLPHTGLGPLAGQSCGQVLISEEAQTPSP